MGRRVTGYVEFRGGRWQVLATDATGERDWHDLPDSIPQGDEALARAVGVRIAQKLRAGEFVPTERDETFSEYLERWCDSRKARGLSSSEEDRGSTRKHAVALAPLPIRGIRREHLEDFVTDLDAKVSRREISWKTARNVWGSVAKMFKDATKAKDRALRVLETNPAVDVAGPDKGDETAKQFLYPNEATTLLYCEDVPRSRRRLYALAIYSYARAGEIAGLTWGDVDLVHGQILIHQSIDRNREPDVVKSTKTKETRRVPLERELVPLLKAMRGDAKGADAVFPILPAASGDYGLASLLRQDLETAGVERSELLKPSRGTKPITFHDLRATGLTWMAVRGDDPLKIQEAAGHALFTTTQIYIRQARLAANFGDPFPTLPVDLLKREIQSPNNRPKAQKIFKNIGDWVGAAGIENPADSPGKPVNSHETTAQVTAETPIDDNSRGHLDDLARALELAARAGEWSVVETLARLIGTLRNAAPVTLVRDSDTMRRK